MTLEAREREAGGTFAGAGELPDRLRGPLRDLLLVLADSKRLLGMRYAEWILGAPALEAGIACSAMAQDEWGHARILYAMLGDFGEDPERLEHEREPSEYRSCALLDRPAEGWPELVALNLLLDTALTVQFEAMREGRFEPLHHKVAKLLEEERFHFEHGRGWTARLASTEQGRARLTEAFAPAFEECLRWFGPDDDPAGVLLAGEGVADAAPAELRRRWLARVGPSVADAGTGLALREEGEGWSPAALPGWDGWDGSARRPEDAPGPDEETIQRVRGDRNRALLLD